MKVKNDMKIKIPESVLGVKKWECEVVSNKNVATYIKEFNRIALGLKNKSGEKQEFFFKEQTIIAQEKVHTQIDKYVQKLNWGLHVLAIMSSTAPFVGLFGTVWGIMDSFFENLDAVTLGLLGLLVLGLVLGMVFGLLRGWKRSVLRLGSIIVFMLLVATKESQNGSLSKEFMSLELEMSVKLKNKIKNRRVLPQIMLFPFYILSFQEKIPFPN